jgi:predicted TIM-barrel fold metal-dependent hydrolase
MPAGFIDIHPHIISDNPERYPRAPLFGVQSDWSRERPVTIEGLIAAMDEAGVQKAAIVQSSTCYGFDNSYLVDAVARYPGRFTAVGSVDMCDAGAASTIAQWVKRGVSGLRLFTGGSTAAFDPSSLDDPRTFAAWSVCAELALSMAIQTDPSGLAQVAGLAKRFPKVRIVLDHLGRPDVTDGAPYKRASNLFGLAPFDNVFLKLTPRIFGDAQKGQATPQTLFPRLVEVFGSNRLAWGSNFPASEGKLSANLELAKKCLACLTAEDQQWVFGRTAQRLYPALATHDSASRAPASGRLSTVSA